jgi:hypothetical protein
MTRAKLIKGKSGRRLGRSLRDFVTGFVLFCVVAGPAMLCPESFCAVLSTSAQAQIHAAEQMDGSHAGLFAGAVAGSHHRLMTLLSLGLAFASVFTLNLWIARHIGQVHATYRRRR